MLDFRLAIFNLRRWFQSKAGNRKSKMRKGPLIVLSGPSGSGKSTVIARLLAACPWPLRLSVSATTRAPRRGEIDGVHYHFWTPQRFEEQVQAGAFLEWA